MSDIAIPPQALPSMQFKGKPVYLVVMTPKPFLAIEANFDNSNYLSIKGKFSDATPEVVEIDYQNILSALDKDRIEFIMVPWVRVSYIKILNRGK